MKFKFSDAPALKYLFYFCIGLSLQLICHFPLFVSLIIFVVILLLILVLSYSKYQNYIFLLCIIATAILRLSLAEACFQDKHQIIQEHMNTEIHVLDMKTNPYYIESYIVHIKSGSTKYKATLYARKNIPILIPGKMYRFTDINMIPIQGNKNPYSFNYLNYARVKGLSHTIKVNKKNIVSDLGIVKPLKYVAYHARNDISIRYLSALGIEKGSLVNGLLLGLKSEIPSCIADLFRELGVSHLLAVSGLHVGLIMMIIYQLLLAFSVPRIPRAVFIAIFLLFYCVLTGGSPSVIRSSLMSLMLLFAPVCMRRYNAMNAVAATAVILLLINPFYLQDLGFQFSFSAVFGILIGYSRLKELVPLDPKNPILKYMIDMLGVSLSAALFTAPVAMFYFNSLQLMSMFLNLLVIPLTFVVMITAIICLPCLYLPSFISDLFIHALDISLDVFRGVLRLASRSSMWTIHLSSFWKPLAMGILFILLFMLVFKSAKLKIYSCIIIVFLSAIWFYSSTRPELIQLSLDKGHAIIYRRLRNALLINTGAVRFNSNDYDRSIEPILDHFGIRDLKIIITKWEKNKYSNIPTILRQYPRCLVYTPQVEFDTEENAYSVCTGENLVFANQDIFVDCIHDELDLSFFFGQEMLRFQNENCDRFPNIRINKNNQEVLHLKLYGKYIHIKE